MNHFVHSLKISTIILSIFTLLLGVVYPCFMWGIGHLFFHKEAEGSILYHPNGKALGSLLIAQSFENDSYFHPRPSYTDFNAANSGGSNLGPTSKKLIEILHEKAIEYRTRNHLSEDTPLPSDAVTSSASGLDPHISVENAKLQAQRVAIARNLPIETIYQLIEDHTEGKALGVFGEKRLNVLLLNLDLLSENL